MSDETEANWQDLIAVKQLVKDWVTPASIGNRQYAVYDTAEGIYVTSGLCSHAGAALCDGYYSDYKIECPLHQGLFDIRQGKAISAPAVRDIRCYNSRVVNGTVQILI